MKIFVFPCGSEVGLEIHRSLRYSTHVHLIGGSSVPDHGRFVYDNYIDNIPFVDAPGFISCLKKLVLRHQIDAICPATDMVIWKLKQHEAELGCKVIASPIDTVRICLSKRNTYQRLRESIRVPILYKSLREINSYPVFFKPNVGHSSQGVFCANCSEEAEAFLKKQRPGQDLMILEYLPGPEYTIDCFTNQKRELLFAGARRRERVANGISVHTYPVDVRHDEFYELAKKINSSMILQGAWFFQVKENSAGEFVLLEVAARLAGSSSLYRNRGINFALLNIFDAFGHAVEIKPGTYPIEMGRALSNKFRLGLEYDVVYVDYDDCLIVNNRVNTELISFLYQSLNNGKRIVLITKYQENLRVSLEKYRMSNLFDEVIHLNPEEEKRDFIVGNRSIFIDDSFQERAKVQAAHEIAVFAPDMIEALIS
jgi:hypothetical protein